MLLALKNLEQADDAGMADFLENVNFLEYLASTVVVLDVNLVNGLDGHLLASQLVDPQGNFTKSPLAQQLNELVEVQCRLRDDFVFLNVRLDVLDKANALFTKRVVEHHLLLLLWLGVLRDAVVVDVDAQVLALPICVNHQLNGGCVHLAVLAARPLIPS